MATLRCLVCQGQAISDSDAEMAGDMRSLVRTRIAAGEKAKRRAKRSRAGKGCDSHVISSLYVLIFSRTQQESSAAVPLWPSWL